MKGNHEESPLNSKGGWQGKLSVVTRGWGERVAFWEFITTVLPLSESGFKYSLPASQEKYMVQDWLPPRVPRRSWNNSFWRSIPSNQNWPSFHRKSPVKPELTIRNYKIHKEISHHEEETEKQKTYFKLLHGSLILELYRI